MFGFRRLQGWVGSYSRLFVWSVWSVWQIGGFVVRSADNRGCIENRDSPSTPIQTRPDQTRPDRRTEAHRRRRMDGRIAEQPVTPPVAAPCALRPAPCALRL